MEVAIVSGLLGGVVVALVASLTALLTERWRHGREDRYRFSEEKRPLYTDLYEKAHSWWEDVNWTYFALVRTKEGQPIEIRDPGPLKAVEKLGRLFAEVGVMGDDGVATSAEALWSSLHNVELARVEFITRGVDAVMTGNKTKQLAGTREAPKWVEIEGDPPHNTLANAEMWLKTYKAAARKDLGTGSGKEARIPRSRASDAI
jgi:hypothetical protein